MQLTDEQRAALKKIVQAKLDLWNAGDAAEELLGRDVPTAGSPLEDYCAAISGPDDLSDANLIEAFELDK